MKLVIEQKIANTGKIRMSLWVYSPLSLLNDTQVIGRWVSWLHSSGDTRMWMNVLLQVEKRSGRWADKTVRLTDSNPRIGNQVEFRVKQQDPGMWS